MLKHIIDEIEYLPEENDQTIKKKQRIITELDNKETEEDKNLDVYVYDTIYDTIYDTVYDTIDNTIDNTINGDITKNKEEENKDEDTIQHGYIAIDKADLKKIKILDYTTNIRETRVLIFFKKNYNTAFIGITINADNYLNNMNRLLTRDESPWYIYKVINTGNNVVVSKKIKYIIFHYLRNYDKEEKKHMYYISKTEIDIILDKLKKQLHIN